MAEACRVLMCSVQHHALPPDGRHDFLIGANVAAWGLGGTFIYRSLSEGWAWPTVRRSARFNYWQNVTYNWHLGEGRSHTFKIDFWTDPSASFRVQLPWFYWAVWIKGTNRWN